MWDRIEAYPHLSVSRDTAASWLLKTASCLMSAVLPSSCSTLALVLMRLGFDCSALIRLGYVSDWCFLLASLTLQLKDVVLDLNSQIASLIVGTRQAPKATRACPPRSAAQRQRPCRMCLWYLRMSSGNTTPRAAGRCYVALVPSAIRHLSLQQG